MNRLRVCGWSGSNACSWMVATFGSAACVWFAWLRVYGSASCVWISSALWVNFACTYEVHGSMCIARLRAYKSTACVWLNCVCTYDLLGKMYGPILWVWIGCVWIACMLVNRLRSSDRLLALFKSTVWIDWSCVDWARLYESTLCVWISYLSMRTDELFTWSTMWDHMNRLRVETIYIRIWNSNKNKKM